MWKIALGFIAFAAVALFVILKGGDTLGMGGEEHASSSAPAASAAAQTH